MFSRLIQYEFLTLSAQKYNCLSYKSNLCNYIANVKIKELNSVRSNKKIQHAEVVSLAF